MQTEGADRVEPHVIAVIGDLVDDVVLRLGGPINVASDTTSVIRRRQGGSGANVAAAVVAAGGAARFIGQVGDDSSGHALVATLRRAGVETVVRTRGRTGTVIVLLSDNGDRTMLTDRGASADLTDPDTSWLDGLGALHVPLYSLLSGPMATTAATLIRWAHERGLLVSIDASSVGAIAAHGVSAAADLIRAQGADVLFCNADEAATLAQVGPLAGLASSVIVKRGAGEATILRTHTDSAAVGAEQIADVHDTTGAGDAFAAGYLVALLKGDDAVGALTKAHRSAAAAIRIASAPSSD